MENIATKRLLVHSGVPRNQAKVEYVLIQTTATFATGGGCILRGYIKKARNRQLIHTTSYLVEHYPLDVANEISAPVEHRPKDLRSHDEAGRFRIDGHVARDEANVSEPGLPIHNNKK